MPASSLNPSLQHKFVGLCYFEYFATPSFQCSLDCSGLMRKLLISLVGKNQRSLMAFQHCSLLAHSVIFVGIPAGGLINESSLPGLFRGEILLFHWVKSEAPISL